MADARCCPKPGAFKIRQQSCSRTKIKVPVWRKRFVPQFSTSFPFIRCVLKRVRELEERNAMMCKFTMEAQFSSKPPCDCKCCQYRQYIKGEVKLNGKKVANPVPLSKTKWHEDGGGDGSRYGHRDGENTRGDAYSPSRATGCVYKGEDHPTIFGMEPGDTYLMDYKFYGRITDFCSKPPTEKEHKRWNVKCQGTY